MSVEEPLLTSTPATAFLLPVSAFRSLMADRFKGSADVATGTVKWFNSTKGFGFIQPDGGGKDVFVHISAVEKAGLSGLNEGAKVSYEIVSDRGKESAGNLRVG
jgi:CspA family cold shock protein